MEAGIGEGAGGGGRGRGRGRRGGRGSGVGEGDSEGMGHESDAGPRRRETWMTAVMMAITGSHHVWSRQGVRLPGYIATR